MGAGQLESFLQVEENCDIGPVVGVGQQGEEAVSRAHVLGEAKHMGVESPNAMF